MTDESMTAAVITASASVIVAVLAYLLNQRSQTRSERRQARLDRVNAQLRDLYGPLQALVSTNERIWEALRRTRLPGAEKRRSEGTMNEAEVAAWKRWVATVLMPINRQMRDLIIEHADLAIEIEIPEPMQAFCAHVAAYELRLAHPDVESRELYPMIDHPGRAFVSHVLDSFQALKAEQARLLSQG